MEILSRKIKVGSTEYVFDSTGETFKKLSFVNKKRYKSEISNKLKRFYDENLGSFTNRYIEVADLKVVERIAFHDLIEQAKFLFMEGHYYASVALCGVIGENICRLVLERVEVVIDHRKLLSNKSLTKLDFATLNKLLVGTNLVSQVSYRKLEQIRKMRNEYVHGRGLLKIQACKRDAKKSLNAIIEILNNEFKPR